MNLIVLTVLIALGWAAATGSFAITNMILGAILAGIGLFVVRDHVTGSRLLRRTTRILALGGLFLYELLISAIRVARLVVQPGLSRRLKPAIIAFPLTVKRDAEITLLANLITLTPGTLSVDVSGDRKVLYIHAIDVASREALIQGLAQGFERRIIEAFQ
jgi:multicomponent Na+:H+ antiporter subunit E